MKSFFQVLELESVLALKEQFEPLESHNVRLADALGRVLAAEIRASADLPGFDRATMDGFAVQAASTYGSSESNPAYLMLVGSVPMGQAPDFSLGAGQAARIATGGMLPAGADAVVMLEHSEIIDERSVEVHRSLAPGQNMVARDADLSEGDSILSRGYRLGPPEIGVLAADGRDSIAVYRRPRVGIISSGDEVVPHDSTPAPGEIRDINAHTLSSLLSEAGALPKSYGIVGDRHEDLRAQCEEALEQCDMVMVSGGSSVGMRDLTLDVIESLPDNLVMVHGISIRPGKPTILASCGGKPFWGLPGHVASAMVVFLTTVRPFLDHLGGALPAEPITLQARLSRNLASVQGRIDFVRVRLFRKNGEQWAQPIIGQSGLIHTMTQADGLAVIEKNSEGLDKGAWVGVRLDFKNYQQRRSIS